MSENLKDKIELYFNVLTRIDSNIEIADLKATTSLNLMIAVMAVESAVIGGYLGSLGKFSVETLNGVNILIVILLIFNIFLFFQWYSASMNVLRPNLSVTKDSQDNYQSFIFFKSIHSMNLNDFITKAKSNTAEDDLSDLLKQIHIVSKIIDDKYENYKKINKWVVSTITIFLIILMLVFSQFQGVGK